MTVELRAASATGKYPSSSDMMAKGGAARDDRGSAARIAIAPEETTAERQWAATPRRKSSREWDAAVAAAQPPPADDRGRGCGGDGGDGGVHAAASRMMRCDGDNIAQRAKKRHQATGWNMVMAIALVSLEYIPTFVLLDSFYGPVF